LSHTNWLNVIKNIIQEPTGFLASREGTFPITDESPFRGLPGIPQLAEVVERGPSTGRVLVYRTYGLIYFGTSIAKREIGNSPI